MYVLYRLVSLTPFSFCVMPLSCEREIPTFFMVCKYLMYIAHIGRHFPIYCTICMQTCTYMYVYTYVHTYVCAYFVHNMYIPTCIIRTFNWYLFRSYCIACGVQIKRMCCIPEVITIGLVCSVC